MSTDIITDRIAVSFSVASVIADHNQRHGLALTAQEIERKYEHLFNAFESEYLLFLEASYSSNTYPKTPSWFNCCPISNQYELINGYIKKALGSFEGGSSRFKGSSHTKPETALRKLRQTLSNTLSFEQLLECNRQGFTFKFELFKDYSPIAYQPDIERFQRQIAQLDLNVGEAFTDQIFRAGGFVACKKVTLTVKRPSDVIAVIVLSNIATQCDMVSIPRVNVEHINQPLLKAV